MATYHPITEVMPLASMVTNAVVGASLGDQIRDDLVALRSGWWFRATRVASTQSTAAAAFSPIDFDTLAMSDTAAQDGSITLVGGSVQTTKLGLWMVGGHVYFNSTTQVIATALYTTDDVAFYKVDDVNDSPNAKIGSGCSAIVQVTSATNIFELAVYADGAGAVVQNTERTALFGVWLGGAP